MTHYDTIVTENEVIRGELADGRVVTIPNKSWTDVDEDTFEGNWEWVTRTIVKDAIEEQSLQSDNSAETLSVTHNHFVDALADSSVIEHEIPETERKRAELLLEHLIKEGVYEQRGQKITVLDELDDSTDEFSKFNWAAFLSCVSEEIDLIVKSIESRSEIIENKNNVQAESAGKLEEVRRVRSLISKIEKEVREIATMDIVDISEEVQHIQKFADNAVMGETNQQLADEIAVSIQEGTNQYDSDSSIDVETADTQLKQWTELESETGTSNEVAETDRLRKDSSHEEQ